MKRFPKAKKPALIIAGLLLLTIVATGSYIAYRAASATAKVASGGIFGLLTSAKLDGEANGRVNILLAGNSADDIGHGGAELTDSIMVVSLDTTSHKATMISVPRDLYVDVPSYGYEKINAAYTQGGMNLLKTVVQNDLGLTINYNVLVNYTAFKQAVDAVGGIDVTIASSDARGIYDPNTIVSGSTALRLTNGTHHLDGATALALARARNDPTADGRTGYGLPRGDLDREADQCLILTALSAKITSSSTWSNPVKLVSLMNALGNNVTTTFSTSELNRLYTLGKSIPATSITSVDLASQDLIVTSTTKAGMSIIVPAAGLDDYRSIQSYIDSVLNPAAATSDTASTTSAAQ